MNANPLNLFAKYADGTISPEEAKELESLLASDKSLRRDFLEYMNVCVVLEDNAAYPDDSDIRKPETLPSSADSRAKFLSAAAFSIAAAVCLVMGVFFLQPLIRPNVGTVTAQVLRNDDAVANGSPVSFAIGDRVTLEQLDLQKGWLRLELPKGVVFDIYGPAKGRFETAERFRLESGRLNVDVGPKGKGFTVVTDNADIVDLGTKFGVELGNDDLAKVAVFSGEVEVHPKERGGQRLLAEGEGFQVGATGILSRLISITITDEQAPQLNPSTRRKSFEIRDNLTNGESLRYYGIVSNGMREGAHVYTTQKRVRWNCDADTPFPEDLIGADLIQTFHSDRNENDLEITLDISDSSTVYVLFDERYETPRWLSEEFVPTGEVVRSGPWRPVGLVHDIIPDPQGYFYIRYKVWKKSVAASGTLTLGESAYRESKSTQRAMYGIAVKPSRKGSEALAETRASNIVPILTQ